MTPESQRIAIAEACGVIECDNWHSFIAGASMMKNDETCGHAKCVPRGMLPNYPGCLNAMHEAEKVLTEKQLAHYSRLLSLACHEAIYDKEATVVDIYPLHATAAQRAKAFLRTIGIWKDT